MPDISILSNITTSATALSNLILVTPRSPVGYQPQVKTQVDTTDPNAQNLPTLVFNYEGEQSITLESDITDHYVEKNYAVQDHIALKPEIVKTQGFIGELNDVAPDILRPLQYAATKLTVIDAYTPALSETAILAYNNAFQAYQVAANAANAAISAWSSVNNLLGSGPTNLVQDAGLQGITSSTGLFSGVQSKQQIIYQQFYGYWSSRYLFTVQTPWAIYSNMAIQSLRAIQSAETRMISDFEITFKRLRFALSVVETNQLRLKQGRLQTQSSGVKNLGTINPQTTTRSVTGP